MGKMIRWSARRGAVGGTARLAAKFYHQCRKQSPAQPADLDEVRRAILWFRYGPSAPFGDPTLLGAFAAMSDTIEEHGLAHLVVLILAAEASYGENSADDQTTFLEVIVEELRKKGMPNEHIYGPAGEMPAGLATITYRANIVVLLGHRLAGI